MTREIIPYPFTRENLMSLDKATYKLSLLSLAEFDVSPDTPEAIDAILRTHGFDPDEVGAKMKDVADRAFSRMKKRFEDFTIEEQI